ncbi:MAG: DEAD/DEAH box helicase [Prevotellaceae bacterium]|nr:DEAD/DEAH box helicase [Prevotellaceae bacterium]
MTFEELGVSQEIRQAIEELGFVQPMPVQEQVIPFLLGHNNDVVALAQTGTGKTAAYGLPLLQKISLNEGIEDTKYEGVRVQAVVIAPTRELCLQISDDLKSYSKYINGLHVLPVYGGSSIETQIRALKKGVQVIVATPGRLVDLMKRGVAKLDAVENVVLDEADEMLSMGFSESIDEILEGVPENRNTLLFSATMSKEIERISKNYLRNATEIVVGSRNEGAELVNHIYYLVQARDKYNALKRVADYYPEIYAIIFCRTRMETQEIADKLIKDGYNAESLHGELSQAQRDQTMAKFRNHTVQLLVATDVAARGLDVDNLTHVINYGLPDDIESYTHRSGRTGRAGKAGTSICIIHVKERGKVRAIEKQIGKQFVAETLPSGEEICRKQLMKVIDDIEKVEVNDEMIAPFMDDIYRKFELMERDEIVKKMVSMQFNQFLNYYKNAPEIIQPSANGKVAEERMGRRERGKNRNERRGGSSKQAEAGYTRLFINIGKKDRLNPRSLMGFVNRHAQNQHFNIGRIDLMNTYSFFEVPEEQTSDVIAALNNSNFDGRTVSVEITDNASAPRTRDDFSNGRRQSFRNEKKDKKAKKRNKKYADDAAFAAPKPKSDGRPAWAQFFEGQVENQPFYGIFEKKKKKAKNKK